MSKLRFRVVESAFEKKATELTTPAERPSEYYGELVFNREKMFKYLPERAYERLVDSIDNGTQMCIRDSLHPHVFTGPCDPEHGYQDGTKRRGCGRGIRAVSYTHLCTYAKFPFIRKSWERTHKRPNQISSRYSSSAATISKSWN